ncbi:hypothetical protein HanIR_Chr15g0779481 [Helianthus annuus]|nr:hypothetical protein HanIR_Chr15g0779481 [Helianthus annuus]
MSMKYVKLFRVSTLCSCVIVSIHQCTNLTNLLPFFFFFNLYVKFLLGCLLYFHVPTWLLYVLRKRSSLYIP